MVKEIAPQRKPVQFRAIGLSYDHRTNRWSVTCGKCDRNFEPATTMYTRQTFDCPKCGAPHSANWNSGTVEYTP